MRWHERLGFGSDQVVLIIHADDGGMSESHNAAIVDSYYRGDITSASVLIDSPWCEQFLAEQALPDVGLHFALRGTSIHDEEYVKSQLDRQFNKFKELQLPTHIDSHGGVVFMSEVSSRTYAEFSIAQSVPALMCLNRKVISRYKHMLGVAGAYPFPVLDDILMAPATQNLDDKLGWVLEKLDGLPPGIYQWIVHPSDRKDGVADVWVLRQPKLKRLLKRRRFVLTNWIDIWDRHSKV